jgi:hypothetical protein
LVDRSGNDRGGAEGVIASVPDHLSVSIEDADDGASGVGLEVERLAEFSEGKRDPVGGVDVVAANGWLVGGAAELLPDEERAGPPVSPAGLPFRFLDAPPQRIVLVLDPTALAGGLRDGSVAVPAQGERLARAGRDAHRVAERVVDDGVPTVVRGFVHGAEPHLASAVADHAAFDVIGVLCEIPARGDVSLAEQPSLGVV